MHEWLCVDLCTWVHMSLKYRRGCQYPWNFKWLWASQFECWELISGIWWLLTHFSAQSTCFKNTIHMVWMIGLAKHRVCESKMEIKRSIVKIWEYRWLIHCVLYFNIQFSKSRWGTLYCHFSQKLEQNYK